MPVHIRNFYFREFMDLKKKEKQEHEKATQQTKSTIPRRFKRKK